MSPRQVADAGHPEVEELKSIIESLQEKQARLQKDRADEVEQLHEVIGRLQRELSLGAPVERGHSLGPAQDLRSELQCGLLCLQAEGAEAQAALQAELHAALAAKDALSQRLAEQERRHRRALEALQQRLRAVEAAATRRLAQLGSCAALQEAEAQGLASQVQEWEAALKAKDVEIAQRDLELEALSRRTAAHSAELEALQVAVARLRRSLEQTPLGTTHEPPKVQRLRAQCVRLSRRLQALNQRFLGCQEELDKQQAHGVPMSPSVETSSQEQVSRSDEAPRGEESEHSTGSRQPTGGDPQVGLAPLQASGAASGHRERGGRAPASPVQAAGGRAPGLDRRRCVFSAGNGLLFLLSCSCLCLFTCNDPPLFGVGDAFSGGWPPVLEEGVRAGAGLRPGLRTHVCSADGLHGTVLYTFKLVIVVSYLGFLRHLSL